MAVRLAREDPPLRRKDDARELLEIVWSAVLRFFLRDK
jgi:hypothetical protein